MPRFNTIALAMLLTACGGGDSDTDSTDTGETIGDGVSPVVISAEYGCFSDTQEKPWYYFRIVVADEQGVDNIARLGAAVLFKDASGTPIDWDGDGTPDPDQVLTLLCDTTSDPRRCEDGLVESVVSGPCNSTTMQFEGWAIDEDGNESEHVFDFEQNNGIAP